jgi:hypothetical protein
VPYKYNKLRGKIIEMYGSLEKFAEMLDISRVSVSKKMTGKVGFSQKDIKEWSQLLNIDCKEYGEYFFT